jgi:hypothetical protein
MATSARSNQVLAGPLALACAPGDLAEAEVAVGDARAHAAFHLDAVDDNSSSNILASRRSAVSKPSVNQE